MKRIQSIDQLVELLKEVDVNSLLGMQGCSDETLDQIASYQDVKFTQLPQLYCDFMRMMGNSTNNMLFLRGEDIKCQHILKLKEHFLEEINEYSYTGPLPEKYFVFWSHQGYQFFFFDFDKHQVDDPPVYWFNYSIPEISVCYDSFSQMLFVLFTDYKRVIDFRKSHGML